MIIGKCRLAISISHRTFTFPNHIRGNVFFMPDNGVYIYRTIALERQSIAFQGYCVQNIVCTVCCSIHVVIGNFVDGISDLDLTVMIKNTGKKRVFYNPLYFKEIAYILIVFVFRFTAFNLLQPNILHCFKGYKIPIQSNDL